jgi:hypothetical protein
VGASQPPSLNGAGGPPASAAAALVVPVDRTGEHASSATQGPQEQAPQAARRRPPPVVKTAPSRRLHPGDLICGACGEGNPPVRKFCSRCGDSLVQAEVVKRPWWKKLIPARGPKVVPTGTHPSRAGGRDVKHGLRKAYRRVRLVIGMVIMGAGLVYAVFPPLRTAVDSRFNAEKTRVETLAHPTYVPVHPVSVAANLHVAGHPGQLAADEFSNTYWLAPWSPGQEPTLTLTFGKKVSLKKMILTSGVSSNFVAFGRPAALHLVFPNGQSDSITPQDTDKPQTLTISHGDGVTSVEIQVAGVFPGSKGSNVAITEMELFALQL